MYLAMKMYLVDCPQYIIFSMEIWQEKMRPFLDYATGNDRMRKADAAIASSA